MLLARPAHQGADGRAELLERATFDRGDMRRLATAFGSRLRQLSARLGRPAVDVEALETGKRNRACAKVGVGDSGAPSSDSGRSGAWRRGYLPGPHGPTPTTAANSRPSSRASARTSATNPVDCEGGGVGAPRHLGGRSSGFRHARSI